MRISDWSSDVCSSDLRRNSGTDGARRHAVECHLRLARRFPGHLAPRQHSAPPPGRAHTVEHRIANRLLIARHQRSEEHTSELQSLMRISYAVFCLKKKKNIKKMIKYNIKKQIYNTINTQQS